MTHPETTSPEHALTIALTSRDLSGLEKPLTQALLAARTDTTLRARAVGALHNIRGFMSNGGALGLSLLTDLADACEKANEQESFVKCCLHIGIVAHEWHDDSCAKTYLQHGRDVAKQLNLAEREGHITYRLGDIAQQEGRYAEAADYFTNARDLGTSIHDNRGAADATFGLAHITQMRGDTETAATLYNDAIPLFNAANFSKGIGNCLIETSLIGIEQGRTEGVAKNLAEAKTIFETLTPPYALGLAHCAKLTADSNRATITTRDEAAALDAEYLQIHHHYSVVNDVTCAALCTYARGLAWQQVGELSHAKDFFSAALNELQHATMLKGQGSKGAPHYEAQICESLGAVTQDETLKNTYNTRAATLWETVGRPEKAAAIKRGSPSSHMENLRG